MSFFPNVGEAGTGGRLNKTYYIQFTNKNIKGVIFLSLDILRSFLDLGEYEAKERRDTEQTRWWSGKADDG